VSIAKFNYWMDTNNNLKSTILNVYHSHSTTQSSISQRNTSSENRGSYWYDLPGISLTLTPTSTSSKFLVMGKICISCSATDNYNVHGRMVRNSTEIGSGSSQSNVQDQIEPWNAMINQRQWSGAGPMQLYYQHVDAPATTSSITYKMQFLQTYDNISLLFNRSLETGWQSGDTSSITVMEIQA